MTSKPPWPSLSRATYASSWPARVVGVLAAGLLLAAFGKAHAQPSQAQAIAEKNPYGILANLGAGIFISPDGSGGTRVEITITPEPYAENPDGMVNAIASLQVPFYLIFYSGVRLDDNACHKLAALANVVGMALPEDGLTANGIATLAGSPRLRDLALSDRNLTALDLGALGSFPKLRRLQLDRAVLSDAHWVSLAKAGNVEELSRQGVALTPHAWKAIQGLPRLKSIVLGGSRVTGKDIEALSEIAGLEKVAILNTRLTAENLRPLARLAHCKSIDLSGTAFDRYSLRVLADVAGLRELCWSSSAVCGRDLSALGRLKNLSSLNLSDTRLDDEGVREIATFRQLRSLNIRDCKSVSDDGLITLAEGIAGLRELSVSGPQLTERGIDAVTRMRELRSLQAYGIAIPSNLIARFQESGALEELILSFPKQDQSSERAKSIMASIGGIASLRRLQLHGLPQNVETLGAIKRLMVLEALFMGNAELDDEGIHSLMALPALRELDISGSPRVSDDSIDMLAQFPSLQIVTLSRCGISHEGMSRLHRKLAVRQMPLGTMKILGEFEGVIELQGDEYVPVRE
jgi:internalin A